MQWPVLAVLPPLMAVHQLQARMFHDDAVYATIAREMLRGQMLYRDLFDHKPPVIHVWYLLVMRLGGESPAALRLSLFLTLGATSIIVALTARQFFGPRVAFVCGVMFGLSTSFVMMSRNASVEQLMLLPMTAALYAFLRARTDASLRWLVLSGALATLAAWTKPVALFNLGAVGACLWLAPGWLVKESLGRRLVAFTAGVSFISAIFVGVLAWYGVLPEALDSVLLFNREYSAALSFAWRRQFVIGGLVDSTGQRNRASSLSAGVS